jgi:hypothetical protein
MIHTKRFLNAGNGMSEKSLLTNLRKGIALTRRFPGLDVTFNYLRSKAYHLVDRNLRGYRCYDRIELSSCCVPYLQLGQLGERQR